MPDVFSEAKRSEVMSRIRGKNNASTELRLISILKSGRVTGWRRHTQLPGHPDFACNKERDRTVSKRIREKGWIPIRVWEHELENPSAVLRRLRRALARTGGANVA